MSNNQLPTVHPVDDQLLGTIAKLQDHKLYKDKVSRDTLESNKVERARQRREDKKLLQERRDLITQLVRLVRDDATPATLYLCGEQQHTNATRFKEPKLHPTIEDMLNGINEEELSKLCGVLPRNRSLEHLYILRNQLTGNSMLPMCNALIAVHSNLLTLDVSRNPIGSIGVIHLANAIEDNRRLRTLICIGVSATDDGETVEGVVALAAALERNS